MTAFAKFILEGYASVAKWLSMGTNGCSQCESISFNGYQ